MGFKALPAQTLCDSDCVTLQFRFYEPQEGRAAPLEGRYLEGELVHGVDGVELVHGEVEQGSTGGCGSVVLPGLVNPGLCHLKLLHLPKNTAEFPSMPFPRS